MKASFVVTVLWTVWSTACAQPGVTVRVYNYAGVSDKVMREARIEGHRVLRVAGIVVHWIDCPLRDGQSGPQYQACETPQNVADIILRIVPRSMEGEQNLEHALGYALPFVGSPATRAYVLYDRVQERVGKVHGISASRLVGYVMAHEIAHLLFGDERHSRRGLMMAYWGEKELMQIESGLMSFDSEEAALLRVGAMARVKGISQQWEKSAPSRRGRDKDRNRRSEKRRKRLTLGRILALRK